MAKRKSVTEKNISYKNAVIELQEIVAAIESELVGVDELAEKVKRASMLIQICQTKLRSTEADIKQTIDSMNEAN